MSNRRYLIECTYVYGHPETRTGIQRVVRNIVSETSQRKDQHEYIPVAFIDGKVYQVNSLAPTEEPDWLSILKKVRDKVSSISVNYWNRYFELVRKYLSGSFRHFQWASLSIAKLFAIPHSVLRRVLSLTSTIETRFERITPLETKPSDCLVLLDSSWHQDAFRMVESLKNSGMDVVAVVYDLIPLTHPQFCDQGLVVVFEDWFKWVCPTADGFLCISKATEDNVRGFLRKYYSEEMANKKWYNHFHLGTDLDLIHHSGPIRTEITQMFGDDVPTYIMVSTIEPRKNHKYLLDAFDALWESGYQVRLDIIGKIGWKCEQLIERIKTHPQWGKLLRMHNDLSDSELDYVYKEAKCLLFPSFVEGFGLPIVEAMQRHKPVMVSDIPVFREIASGDIAYFDLEDSGSLKELIIEFETSGVFPSSCSGVGWQPLSWKQAADQFVERLSQSLLSGPVEEKGTSEFISENA